MKAFPIEFYLFLPTLRRSLTHWGEVNVPECFWSKCFDMIVPLDDEAECRELAGPWNRWELIIKAKSKHTVRDYTLLISYLFYLSLQSQSLHPCECSSDSKVQEYSRIDSICLTPVEFDGMLCSTVNLPIQLSEDTSSEKMTAYWAMIALNLARLMFMFGFALRQTLAISIPMCSPSLSQSVHIISASDLLACVLRFCSMDFLSVAIWISTGASNKENGSQDVHLRWDS